MLPSVLDITYCLHGSNVAKHCMIAHKYIFYVYFKSKSYCQNETNTLVETYSSDIALEWKEF